MSKLFPEIHVNNSGHAYSIIESNVSRDKRGNAIHRIRFLNTGYETEVRQTHVKSGSVRDYMEPHVRGVGYWGANPKSFSYTKKEHTLWYNLISRVYGDNPRNKSYHTVQVTCRWYCFKNFVEDIRKLDGYDKWCEPDSDYQLDKDELSKRLGFKLYSTQTCRFISSAENLELSLWDKTLRKLFDKAVDIREAVYN
ncbi:hypothetical protein GTGU_03585 [Trabulsiella guamensis ATCC 49490]|uniref:Uncharacterized protein n=1 Tax=Trabulsiella guamensis ATCC 49490 TaxID=1005994 RepID=A0A084ZUC3_9ENTR|nr:hypothetical protein [Trabulsiella guamensis]KFC01068.1 hypothetical protein GTGU_03585 [Trabulsiella guamensis ATCC 49490]